MTAIEKIQTVITPLKSIDKINEIIEKINNANKSYTPPLLEPFWFPFKVNRQDFLLADTFSWHSKTSYSSAYAELLSEYDNAFGVVMTDFANKTDIVLPTFTANTTDGITVTDARDNTDAYTLINGVTYKLIGEWSSYWFSIDYNRSTLLKSYSITADSSGNAEYPSDWTLQASNDGSSWVTIDTQNDITFTLGETKTFAVNLSALYKQYKLVFSDGLLSSGNGELAKLSFNAQTAIAITYKRTPKGHKIALADQETAILNKYTATGIAYYFLLDKTNQRFKLPRTKWGFKGLRDSVCDDIDESLPNFKGAVAVACTTNAGYNILYTTEENKIFEVEETGNATNRLGSGSVARTPILKIDGSKASKAYQDNAPVQERGTQAYLYFYVGEYTPTATEQTAGLNAELFNGKLDTDFNNMNPTQTVKDTIVGWGTPDFSAGVSASLPFTAPKDGICAFEGSCNSGQYFTLSVNGNKVGRTCATQQSGAASTLLFKVQKDDVISYTYSNNEISKEMTFFPLKGAN